MVKLRNWHREGYMDSFTEDQGHRYAESGVHFPCDDSG